MDRILKLLKIKVLKGDFQSNAIEEPFLVPQGIFQKTVLKRSFFYTVNILII